MYGAIPRTTETEPETDTDTETENGNGNGTFNIRDFGLSTHIRSFVRVIFSVCLSVHLLDIWHFLYLPTLALCAHCRAARLFTSLQVSWDTQDDRAFVGRGVLLTSPLSYMKAASPLVWGCPTLGCIYQHVRFFL